MSLFRNVKAWWRRQLKDWRAGRIIEPASVAEALLDTADGALLREPSPIPLSPRIATEPPEPPRPGTETVAASTEPAAPRRRTRPAPPDHGIRLALQGGGSHGAFTWGVLDRLLERPGIRVEALSGTSAGALNGAMLATGWARDGARGAREAMAAFWADIGRTASLFSLLPREQAEPAPFGFDALPGFGWGSSLLRTLSPYDYNPLNYNPLREVVERHVDVDALRSGPIRLFVTSTAVRSGRPRVFTGEDLDIDALLASACLPFLFQAVEIDGEPYWDGGYSGNPSLYPLIDPALDSDIVVVRINPALRQRTPRRSVEIIDRNNEITFNASLITELRAIALVRRMLDDGVFVAGRFRGLRLHMIADDIDLATLPASSRMWADPAFIGKLHDMGHAAAERFLSIHGNAIGVRSSFDIGDELRDELRFDAQPAEGDADAAVPLPAGA